MSNKPLDASLSETLKLCCSESTVRGGILYFEFDKSFAVLNREVSKQPRFESVGVFDLPWLLLEIWGTCSDDIKSCEGRLSQHPEALELYFLSCKAYLETLPRVYDVFIGLPGFKEVCESPVKISSAISLVGRAEQPPSVGNALLQAALGQPSIRGVEAALKITVAGLALPSEESSAFDKAISLGKRVAYLLTALGKAHEEILAPTDSTTCWAEDRLSRQRRVISLSGGTHRLFASLVASTKDLRVHDGKDGSTLLLGRTPETPEELSGAFSNSMLEVRAFFEAAGREEFERVVTAIDWYQAAGLTTDQTMAYLMACIGIEAIYNDDDYLSNQTRRLADRYAFSFGRTSSERKTLSDLLLEVFRLRGKLVHARQSKLAKSELRLYHQAQDILERSIRREMQPMVRRAK